MFYCRVSFYREKKVVSARQQSYVNMKDDKVVILDT